MWYSVLAALAFAVMAVPVLPLPRVRYIALGLLHRAVHLAVLAAVTGSALLFFAPWLAPQWLLDRVQPTLAWFGQAGPEGRPGFAWLPVGALFVACSLPLLTLIDFAQRLAGFTALVGRAFGQICRSAHELEQAIAADSPRTAEKTGDMQAALEAVREITGQGGGQRSKRRPLIAFLSSNDV